MEITLRIKQEDGKCSKSCMFLDADNCGRYGKCVLFSGGLLPLWKNGKIFDGWLTTNDCDDVMAHGFGND